MLLQTDDSIGEEDGDHSLHHYKKVLPLTLCVLCDSKHDIISICERLKWADFCRLCRVASGTAIWC